MHEKCRERWVSRSGGRGELRSGFEDEKGSVQRRMVFFKRFDGDEV